MKSSEVLHIDVGSAILHIRDQQRKTQRRFAKELGISPVHMCRVEKGIVKASLDLIDRVEKLTGINPYVFAWNVRNEAEKEAAK